MITTSRFLQVTKFIFLDIFLSGSGRQGEKSR